MFTAHPTQASSTAITLLYAFVSSQYQTNGVVAMQYQDKVLM